jgi:hypothetical protein
MVFAEVLTHHHGKMVCTADNSLRPPRYPLAQKKTLGRQFAVCSRFGL